MKIIVIGGTELIGSRLVEELRDQGHDAVAAAPDTGVNTLTGEGLDAVLTLADVDGRTVGSRAFQPSEYLGATPTQSTLGSGQSARIEMDLVEPAPGVVAFTFDFR